MVKRFFSIETIFFCLLCLVSMFYFSSKMVDEYIMPKWYLTILVLLLGIILILAKKLMSKSVIVNVVGWSYIIAIICLIEAFYGIGQWLNFFPLTNNFKVTGTFDNPAGFAASLCIGFPFLLICLKSAGSKILRILLYTSGLLIVFALIISESRTGVLSIIVFVVISVWQYIPLKTKNKIILFICLLIPLVICLYTIKKDSANGRLLIWNCCWKMIEKSPVLGYGPGSFRANYMDYQAEFFFQNPDDKNSMLADNVLYPFNEYISVILNFGFIGLLLLFISAFGMILFYLKKPTFNGKIALYSLLILGVFSFFSYPLTYPFVWVILAFDIYIILKPYLLNNSKIRHKYTLFTICLLFCLVGVYKTCLFIQAEYKWKSIIYTPNISIAEYSSLEKSFSNDPYFIYSYAVILYESGCIEESLRQALRCRSYWADYELEILLGNIYKKMGDVETAESHFTKASFMCPNRFVPLYQLYKIYKETEKEEQAALLSEVISNKPVKINSLKVMQIKRAVVKGKSQ